MDVFLAEHGLALLAVIVCLVATLAIAPGLALLLSGSEYRDDLGLTMPLAVGQALLVVAGAWWVVGSPGDWSLVLRAVAAGGALYAILATGTLLDDVHWRLGQGERRVWDPAVPLGSAVIAVGAWWAIGAWLPLPLAISLVVLLLGAAAWWWLRLLRGGGRGREEPRRRLTDSPAFLRAILSAASSTYAAWCDLDDAMPPDWTVGEPRFDADRNAWQLQAVDGARLDPPERVAPGSRPHRLTASAPSEVEVIREMARRFRAIGNTQARE